MAKRVTEQVRSAAFFAETPVSPAAMYDAVTSFPGVLLIGRLRHFCEKLASLARDRRSPGTALHRGPT